MSLRADDASGLPLEGRTIIVTRAREQSSDLLARLRALGATPIECPAIVIAPLTDTTPLDKALSRLEAYDWVIFTSSNGVSAVAGRMAALGIDVGVLCGRKLGAIGPATRAALEKLGCRAAFMPDTYVAESLLVQIGGVAGRRVLLPQADIAREALAEGLREGGAAVDEMPAYHTVHGGEGAALADLLRSGSVDAVTFTSSSTVRYTLDGLVTAGLNEAQAVKLLNKTAVVCIGPITAGTAEECGLLVAAVAEEHTTQGLVASLVRLFTQPSHVRNTQ